MTMTVETINRLIANYNSQIEKLEQIQDMFVLAEAFEVSIHDILSSGYKPPTRGEYTKWSRIAKARLPFFSTHGASASDHCERLRNRCHTRDGRELTLIEPVFLKDAPPIRNGYCKVCGTKLPLPRRFEERPTVCAEVAYGSHNASCESFSRSTSR